MCVVSIMPTKHDSRKRKAVFGITGASREKEAGMVALVRQAELM